ncbi:hypothetical protein K7X08_028894 [Anisodus acutangulus]|uniref:Uncharacterized protein n=1 Tax=Anisodus acutangulus TaxID=402998 RepID=A0A9Q1L436_9SOLA|nr:hypothetical protein K7X08_028894 [Anisodus acutangulus]
MPKHMRPRERLKGDFFRTSLCLLSQSNNKWTLVKLLLCVSIIIDDQRMICIHHLSEALSIFLSLLEWLYNLGIYPKHSIHLEKD